MAHNDAANSDDVASKAIFKRYGYDVILRMISDEIMRDPTTRDWIVYWSFDHEGAFADKNMPVKAEDITDVSLTPFGDSCVYDMIHVVTNTGTEYLFLPNRANLEFFIPAIRQYSKKTAPL